MLTTNSTANPTVHRFRLRSTSEPPPSGPAPVPTPKAPDRPGVLAGVHEDEEDQPHADEHLDDVEDRGHGPDGICVVASAPRRAGAGCLDRLRAQRPVDRPVVLVGQLAGPHVELGVADLAVLGVPRRLQLGHVGRLALGRARGGAPRAAAPRSRSTAPASTTRTTTYAIRPARARAGRARRRRTRRLRAVPELVGRAGPAAMAGFRGQWPGVHSGRECVCLGRWHRSGPVELPGRQHQPPPTVSDGVARRRNYGEVFAFWFFTNQ